jgi:aromatic-L-amino-acid decarboxylase
LQKMVRAHVALAQQFAEWVRKDDRFEMMAPATLNLACFRLKASDEVNEKLLRALNTSGKLYISHTRLNGKYTLRFCVGQTYTEERHVKAAWEEIRKQTSALK